MTKSRNKSYRRDDLLYSDGYGLNSKKEKMKNKSKEKRFERAIKVHNIDELMNLDNEGLDPIDVEDEIYKDYN